MIAGSIVMSDNPPQQLKFWRNKFGVKQAVLARKMEITPSVLSDYEKGRRPSPGVNFIKRYLLALHEVAKGGRSGASDDNANAGGDEQPPQVVTASSDSVQINQPG